MSEYQCYEFVALDQPLTRRAMAELRSISTRAEISPTRFRNEYDWGDLKADPPRLLARYFGAHLYFANWGTRRFMLRVPAARIEFRALRAYFPGGAATLKKTGRFLSLEMVSDCEEPEDDLPDDGTLGRLVPLRARLLQGDVSVAYLAWLLPVQSDDVPADRREPPVPAGLGKPLAAVAAFGEFLRVDRDLLRAAAEGSRPSSVDGASLRRWLKAVPSADKDRWLLRAVTHPDAPLTGEILAAHRPKMSNGSAVRRTVAELQERAAELRGQRKRQETLRAAKAGARAEAAHGKRLAALERQGDTPWVRLDRLIDSKHYDEAVRLTTDLRDVAKRNGHSGTSRRDCPAFESGIPAAAAISTRSNERSKRRNEPIPATAAVCSPTARRPSG